MNHSPLNPLGLTSSDYAELVKNHFGKGNDHALALYKEWIRHGSIPLNQPIFKNAQKLLRDIAGISDFSLLPLDKKVSEGSTQKFLLKTAENFAIESVIIPMQAGGTLCVSSQVGCRMGCAFCETGRMGLLKNLKPFEITSQVFAAKHFLQKPVRNIVFMGMGEPFDNYEHVLEAFRILIDPQGFDFGERHITISTSGVIPGIERLMNEKRLPNLAVSLNSADEELRRKLMPVTRKWDLKQLYEAMQAFNLKTGRQILVAYVLMQGINDTLEHAKLLADYVNGLDVKINLIPYNPQSNDRFHPPEPFKIELFKNILKQKGLRPLVRVTKGDKIMAACGQLGTPKPLITIR